MLKNKGFTVIELILSFAFCSILTVTLFAAALNYRTKEQDVSIETKIRQYRSQIVLQIQKDIESKVLSYMDYCKDASGKQIDKCVTLYFNDNTKKDFKIENEKVKITIGTDMYQFYAPYISYGGIKYTPPDQTYITFVDDYLFSYTDQESGIESNTSIYSINVIMEHSQSGKQIPIKITAAGTKNYTEKETNYKEYRIGQKVAIQINSQNQLNFYVIKPSGKNNRKLILLAENNYNNATPFATEGNITTKYDEANIKNSINLVKQDWINAEEIRLITAEEISYIMQACPKYVQINAIDLPLTQTSGMYGGFITTESYWTSSPYKTNEDINQVWAVDKTNKKLTPKDVTTSYGLRPVIEIDKKYVNSILDSGESSAKLMDLIKPQAVKDNQSSTYVKQTTGIDFSKSSNQKDASGNYTNGKGVYLLSSTELQENPIYYYRGDTYNNNLLFANMCWKIVRTTETGGIKIIYNGIPTNSGACNNTGKKTQIGTSVFNSNYDDNTYVGYMYGTENAATHEITHENLNDSNIKTMIDKWYEENLLPYTDKIDDAVWYNDRAISPASPKNGVGKNAITYYAQRYRIYDGPNKMPSLNYTNANDKFTVGTGYGNGKLKYPVGLLTADEMVYAGAQVSQTNNTYYLYTGEYQWSMTPGNFLSTDEFGKPQTSAHMVTIYENGEIREIHEINKKMGVRPSIVLKKDTIVTRGNGTTISPYTVE